MDKIKNWNNEDIENNVNITELIRKRSFVGEDRNMEISEIDVPYRIGGVRFFRSSYQFHIDPVPHDTWIVVDGKLKKGYQIKDVLKEKNVVPKSKEDAINIAKLIRIMEQANSKIYPDFPNKSGGKMYTPKATEKDGIYEVVLYTSSFPYTFSFKNIFRIGEGIYESRGEGKS